MARATRRKRGGLVKKGATPPQGKRHEATVVRTLKHRAVVKLTERIVKMESEASTSDVYARVEIGAMLGDVRDMLPHGEWL